MKVSDLMSSPARTCHVRDSLERAAQLLWAGGHRMLPVVDDSGRIRAVIADRDVLGAWVRARSLDGLHVADAMSTSVVTCRPDELVGMAAQRMVAHGLRHLPVVDDHDRPCGVISLHDLALRAEGDVALGRATMRVLTASCRHRVHEAGAPLAAGDAGAPGEPPPAPSEQKAATGLG
jgi:CBS domain-containing protein